MILRSRIASWLVWRVSHAWDRDYDLWCQHDMMPYPDKRLKRMMRISHRYVRFLSRFVLPLAERLDRQAAGQAMSESGWWG